MTYKPAKVRIPYIDVAKGLLIITLVLHHIPYVILDRNSGLHNAFIENLHEIRWYLYGPYFMSAFFLITGMCSNFKKEFKPFVQDTATSLLVPVLILGLGDQRWFITALFVARIYYWLLTNYVNNKYIRLSIIILTAFLGCVANNDTLQAELLSWQHASLATVFLFVGNEFKEHFRNVRKLIFGGGLYILFATNLYLFRLDIPWFEAGIHITYISFIPFLVLSITGCCIPLLLAKCVSKLKVLQFIGKNSLVIYLIHIKLVYTLVDYLYGSINKADSNTLTSVCIVGFIVVTTISICTIIAKCLDNKYLRWTTGKL